MSNGSLDFLNMIKQGSSRAEAVRKPAVDRDEFVTKVHEVNREETANAQAANQNGNLLKVQAEMKDKAPLKAMTEKNNSVAEKECAKNRENTEVCTGLIAVIDTETNWHDEVMSIGVALADVMTFKCVDRRYYIFEPECMVGGIFSNVLYKCDVKAVKCHRDLAMSDIGEYLMEKGVQKIFAYNAKFDYGHLPELQGFEWFDIMRLAAYKQYNRAITPELPCCKTGRLKSNYGVEPIMRMLTGNGRYYETHNAVLDAVDELKIVELLGHGIEAYECARL